MLSSWLGEQERAAFLQTRNAARPHATSGIADRHMGKAHDDAFSISVGMTPVAR